MEEEFGKEWFLHCYDHDNNMVISFIMVRVAMATDRKSLAGIVADILSGTILFVSQIERISIYVSYR